ncbi:hypothetical protein KIH87_03345 [Paraneptunicella aestuarii]|uniref:phage tail tube protein n=1 Tax=Paraneptunicella aestuarii TaxID=2831148 RepID=UPI001E2EF41A|nr:phage tail tube protein [Paraneptunicella aestuarii]UAA39406.1 hypothetical protein KIH87_03345 [Paraneptunicella aestuarii]
MKFKSKTLLAKLEASYGVDPLPIGTDGIQTKNLQVSPYIGDTISRDLDRETLGAQEQININPHVEVTFEVELAGSGTAGNAPAYSSLLKACGFEETVNAGVDVSYQPVSTNFPSVTLYYLHRNDAGGFQQQTITGCRGSVSITVDLAGIPVLQFRFLGFYQAPSDVADITVDNSDFVDPVYVSYDNTSLTIGAYTAKASAFSIDMANELSMRNVTGARYVNLFDRAPSGQTTVDAPALSAKDFYSLVESHNGVSKESVVLTHGTLAGNIVEISAPQVQFNSITHADSSGELAYQLGMLFLPANGNDEIVLTFK